MTENLYEAMFVVDAAKGGSEFPEVIRHIAGLLKRHGAVIKRIEKWAERKLAYPIKHVKRGIYVLVYFTMDGQNISELRRSVGLSEQLLRVLIVRAERQSEATGELYSPEGELVAAAVARTSAPVAQQAQSAEHAESEPSGEGAEQIAQEPGE